MFIIEVFEYCEPEQSKGLKGNQSMFDKLFKPILNDEVVSDLEKLYDM